MSSRSKRRALARARWSTAALATVGLAAWGVAQTTAFAAPKAKVAPGPRCPWTSAAQSGRAPGVLASEVVARMTTAEKIGVVNLAAVGGYENRNSAVPRLCIPSLTLQDSPNGIAYGAKGVTQLPASLGVAASFNTAIAYDYGRIEGLEARGKGIDVVQGPELNLDRVPESGRAFEAYGEDPSLTAAMGVANIEGIQSTGVMADAKHYTVYNQETARLILNQVVSPRALAELYQPPFQAAVQRAHVATIMCSYGELNGVNTCSSTPLYKTLSNWGFTGFVRSDLGAVTAPVAAFRAGMSMLKPAAVGQLTTAVEHGALARSRLDDAVRRVLSEMFAFHMVEHPPTGSIKAKVTDAAHATFARQAAEASIVLLKNARGILPLRSGRSDSVAVIGTDASTATMSAGYGSAHVLAPYVVTPLQGLRAALGRGTKVTYAAGGGSQLGLAAIPASVLSASRALLGTTAPSGLTGVDPEGVADLKTLRSPVVSRAIATASAPMKGANWATWTATLTPPKSGLYTFSLGQIGDTWLSIDGRTVIGSAGLHGISPWSTAVDLVAGRHYRLRLTWFVASNEAEPHIGWTYDTPAIEAAQRAARAAHTAVVFVNDYNTEGTDRPNLSLPGDENQLVAAVAAANPRTIVVLNTGGPVLMPWLSKVAAVLEAWYPGQEGGNAVAAVVTGRVDPSGHLPVTFPSSGSAVPAGRPSSWPGVDARVSYREGLDIGYRYDQAFGITPLFAFGFGLSYTTFALSNPSLATFGRTAIVEVNVANTGKVAGRAVVQVYVGYPPGSGEPPEQLRAFTSVALAPGTSAIATMSLPQSAFEAYVHGSLRTLSGDYSISIGQSSTDLGLRLALRAP